MPIKWICIVPTTVRYTQGKTKKKIAVLPYLQLNNCKRDMKISELAHKDVALECRQITQREANQVHHQTIYHNNVLQFCRTTDLIASKRI